MTRFTVSLGRFFRSFGGLCALGIGSAWSAEVHVNTASNAAAFRRAMASITQSEVTNHVEVLAADQFEGRDAGSRGGRAAAGLIVQQLKGAGLAPAGDQGTYFQSFPPGFRNVIGVLPGTDPNLSHELVVCCAHYDHVGYGTRETSRGPLGWVHNGADDNASGVAAMLEVLEAFHEAQIQPRRSILFAFWDAEERGLLGSQYWLEHSTLPALRIVAAFNIDMIGRLADQRLEIHGSRTTQGWRQRLVELNAGPSPLSLRFPWKIEPNSDHYPFFQAGIPVIMFHTGLHSDYHTPHDDVEKINLQGLHEISRLSFALVEQMANQTEPLPAFRPESKTEQQEPVWLTAAQDRPRLGLSWETLVPPTLRSDFGQADRRPDAIGKGAASKGAYRVTRVLADSPAARAGIAIGDELLQVNGSDIQDSQQLRQVIATANEPIDLLIRKPGTEPLARTIALDGAPVRFGIVWKRDPGEPRTVIVTAVVPGSVAELRGIRPLQRIHRINGRAVLDDQTIAELVQSQEELVIDLEQDGQFVSVPVALGPVRASASVATKAPIPFVQ